jgi:uncharacterized protein (TIGR03435 family)
MKTLLRCFVVIAILTGGVAHAQNIAGAWQGTLNVGKELRLVFVLGNAAGGGLTGLLHSIDQGGQGIAASPVTFEGSTLRLAIGPLGVTYEGQLSADGNTIAGTFTQGGKPVPLTLRRATPDTAWPIPALPKPMAADAPMVFEVATIKPSNPDAPGKVLTMRGRQFATLNTSLSDLISFAYRVHGAQITGAPEWVASARYDITAQPQGDGTPNESQLRLMVQKLMEDRFQLTLSRGQKELPVYVLTVAKGGHKLTPNDRNPNGLPTLFFKGFGVLPALNTSMGDLSNMMQAVVLDRPVVNRTELNGRFDFTLTWTPDDSQFRTLGGRPLGATADPNGPPGLFTAIQEQLGLRLEPARAPAEVLVVERVERPSDN